jgi:Holliday junction resolvase
MTSKSKQKGAYHEKFFVKLLEKWGITVRKQPLSGALGGEYAGDLVIQLADLKLIAEVKYRADSGFPSPFTVLEGRDIALFKRGKGEPRWIMIVPDRVLEQFVKDYEIKKKVKDD